MAGKSDRAGRRTLATLFGAGGLAVLVAASTAACGSSMPTNTPASPVAVDTSSAGSPTPSPGPSTGSSSGSSAPGTAPSSAPSAVASSTGSTGGQGGAPTGGAVIMPQAQLAAPPAGGKLVPFDSAERSSSGTTLYLGLVSQGGACGQYDVVLEQGSSSVGVGLVLLPSGGRICPMFMGHMLVEAKLAAPLGGRPVVDLANDQAVPVSAS